MQVRTPLIVITGPLGSGKTTLLRHLVATAPYKMAILMNEFGEMAIDSHIVTGKNVKIAELGGGCVCCSLLGEFEAAVEEVIDTVHPDVIVLETTGVAEPDALIVDVQESLSGVRLDGVIMVADADVMVRYPDLGYTSRMQIEAADLILLNKVDLVSAPELDQVEATLTRHNELAPILRTRHCRVDVDLVFGMTRERELPTPSPRHQPQFISFSYTTSACFKRRCFEQFAAGLDPAVIRAKGFVRFSDGTYLFNFVAGRWDLEPFAAAGTALVFIGKDVVKHRTSILHALKSCELEADDAL
jgi:G3E family GTPase